MLDFERRGQPPQEILLRAREYIKPTSIDGLWVIQRPTFRDNRGFFREAVRANEIELLTGVRMNFAQWNHSLSRPGVIRALHAEGWNKIVYPITGKMFAAIADVRPESPTFAKVETFTFDPENPNEEFKLLLIKKSLANSICVVGDKPVHYLYLVDAYYSGNDTSAIAYNDPDLNIQWPVEEPIISDRDRAASRLREMFPQKFQKDND